MVKDNKIISKEDNWGTKKMLFQSKDNFGGILIKYPKKKTRFKNGFTYNRTSNS